MLRAIFFNLALVTSSAGPATALAACPPPEQDRASLEALKASGFEVADDSRRQALALGLLPCLADPDPRRFPQWTNFLRFRM